MSWKVELRDADGNVVDVKEFELVKGHNSVMAEINVTYNYHEMTKALCIPVPTTNELAQGYFEYWGFSSIHGCRAGGTTGILRMVVERCGVKQWGTAVAPTPGNVGHMAAILWAWAEQHPNAVWHVV